MFFYRNPILSICLMVKDDFFLFIDATKTQIKILFAAHRKIQTNKISFGKNRLEYKNI